MLCKVISVLLVAGCASPPPDDGTVHWHKRIENAEQFKSLVGVGDVVSFKSRGGEVRAGLEMGAHMRRVGASAVVDSYCNSACSIALLGAVNVSLDKGDDIAVHRSSNNEQWVYDLIDAYATGMGAAGYAEVMWSVPYDDMRLLTEAQKSEFYR